MLRKGDLNVKRNSLALGLVVVTLAGCGGGSGATFTQLSGPWSTAQQGDFEGACEASASNAFCVCALRYARSQDPSPDAFSTVAGMSPAASAGLVVGEHPGDAPGCDGK
jgi:hypothetical protein